MKQSIILWLAAFVLTFLSGYFQSLTSPDYPISGSFSIGLKKVSYLFDKTHRGKNGYKIIVRTDVDNLRGKILWRKKSSKENWHTISMKPNKNEQSYTIANILYAVIPNQTPKTKVEYKAVLSYKDKTFHLPQKGNYEIEFLGKVPGSIMFFSFIILFGALLLSVRTALDYFNENEKIKKLALFSLMLWILYAMIFEPVKRTYELSSNIGLNVPPVSEIFNLNSIVMLGFWILSLIIIFNIKKYKAFALAAGIITLIWFQFM